MVSALLWVGVAAADKPVPAPSAPVVAAPAPEGSSESLSELEKRVKQLTLENNLADQQVRRELARLSAEKQRLELEKQRVDLINQIALQKQQAEITAKQAAVAQINADLDLRDKREQWRSRVNADIAYTKEPFQKGVLTISDRRIALNGPIGSDTADHILERIDYFNNQNREYPIFIVIDESPGGDVGAGHRILNAMRGSPAPVYVVVKTFAASMAAVITTLAKRSFAYPNAQMIHHQMSSGVHGNVTEQREHLKETEESWRRLATPVAAKMGITIDEFIKRMYQHRSTGNWVEWGDEARKLKWVDDVVDVIREESYIRNPDVPRYPQPFAPVVPLRRAEAGATSGEQIDSQGHPFLWLPRLNPLNSYYLYNPDGYYRVAP